jgi:hypothetical protein
MGEGAVNGRWKRLRGAAAFDESGLLVAGVRVPLIGAEYHFWRQQATFWRDSIEAVCEAGIPMVSTFVCWDFHEPEPGRFDFRGETAPERDLVGFLELCDEYGLYVILRPGPIIDAEWETRGPARDVCTLERNDPRFRERAAEYLTALAQAVAPLQVTTAGPIALVAIDNEIYFPYASDPAWHDEDGDVLIEYKREFVAERWREWLRARFSDDVSQLRAEFGIDAQSFEEIDVPRFSSAGEAEVGEAFELIDSYCAEYLDALAGTLRSNGVDVPFYTNQKQFLAYLNWKTVGRSLDSVGLNICMPNLVPRSQALTMSWFLRLQRARGGFSWSPEYQAGWIGFDEEFGVISPEHGLYMGLLGAALGLRGMSFFMFVERDDWNWSPVNAFGKIRPRRFAAYKQLVTVMRQLSADRQIADAGLLWSLSEHRQHLAATTEGWEDLFKHWMALEEDKEPGRWWATFQRLQAADADFRIVDIAADVRDWPPVVIFAGGGAVEEADLAALAAALDAGIKVVAVGRLPIGLRPHSGVFPGTPATAWGLATAAGAKRYLESSDGSWSIAYAEPAGSTVVFVVNPTPNVVPIELGGELAASGTGWTDLLTGELGSGTLGAAFAGRVLAPNTVRVIRVG